MASMHIWISLAGAPVPVLSTADQVTTYIFTGLTQRPLIDTAFAFIHSTQSTIQEYNSTVP